MLSGNTPCLNDLLQMSDIGLEIYVRPTTFFYYIRVNIIPLKSHDVLLLQNRYN